LSLPSIAVNSTPALHIDDCEGGYEDDSSEDLSILQLSSNVPESSVRSPLLKPYLGGDLIGFLTNDYDGTAWAAGWGGTNAEGDSGSLFIGQYQTTVGLDDDNWFGWGISTDSWWMWMPRTSVASTNHGDSGGAFAVFRLSDQRWWQIGVVDASLRGIPTQADRDLFTPTWNNGEPDRNGSWIAQYLHDADDDGVNDRSDNCAPSDERLTVCAKDVTKCTNADQADSDFDGVGDACDNCPGVGNSSQSDADKDGVCDACDACPYSTRNTPDSDGDGVGDACDNCKTGPNPYPSCYSDADCGSGVCTEGQRCSRQTDDVDGDGIGGTCDECPYLANSDRNDNSNTHAELRLNASSLADLCDPVPIYVVDQAADKWPNIGPLPDPNEDLRNPANSLTLTASAQIGHDLLGLTNPVAIGDLARETYQGRAGFRFCSCQRPGGALESEELCITERCAVDPREYPNDDTESNWKRITVAPSASTDFSNDLARGAEIDRTYTSDLSQTTAGTKRVGALESLSWSFWKDLSRNGQGGSVGSRVVDGQVEINGLFWSHTIGEGFGAASARDYLTNEQLRDTYKLVSGPFYQLFNPISPPLSACGALCGIFIDPHIWELIPIPPDDPEIRDTPNIFGDPSRIWAGVGQILAQQGDRFNDVTNLLPGQIRQILQDPSVRVASPVESTADRLAHDVRGLFASVRTSSSGTFLINEIVATVRGQIEQAPAAPPASGPQPGLRANTQNVYSAAERAVYMIGGTRQTASGAVPTGEIWRYSLDTGQWTKLGVGKTVGVSLANVLAATYDSSTRQLLLASKTNVTTPFATSDVVRLSSVDSGSGVARQLGVLPAVTSSLRGLTVTRDHTLVMATQKNASTVELFELSPTASPPSLLGYAAISGTFDGNFFAPDDIQVPIVSSGTPHVRTLSLSTLRQKIGLASSGDQDKDGVVDVLDDCPGTYDPAQLGCPNQSNAVLFASSQLTLADRVSTTGPSPLLISAGTQLTQVGVEAKIGTLESRAAVDFKDRAHASGAILSSGTVTPHAGATADGGIKSNVSLAFNPLSSFTVTFPTAGPPVTVGPDQHSGINPGSFGDVHVYSRSTLALKAGNYYFTSLTLEPQSAIVVDSQGGAVKIYVRAGLTFRGAMLNSAGGMPQVLLAYFGTSPGVIDASFDGLLVAPKAQITLASTKHSGAFFANQLVVQAGATVLYEPLPIQWWPTSR